MSRALAPLPALEAALVPLLRLPDPAVLVDGRSGSGKTTFAAALARLAGAALLRLEDLYPGWDGLDRGAAAAAALLAARRRGGIGSARTWDWGAGAPGRAIRPPVAGPLVVEGCGALSRRTAPLADLAVWVALPDAERRTRALERDGEVYAPHWERWARQERRVVAREDPRALADLVVDGSRFPQPVFSARTPDAHYPRRP
jgi:hypothetical protein